MDLSRNSLTNRLKKFLKSENSVSNKSQARIDINKHIEKSILFLHHILNDTKSLDRTKVYDEINANSLNEIFQNSLKIKSNKRFVYDFRSVELARLMFEISSRFISSSPQLLDNKFLKEDLEKVSQYFITLSKSVLQQHAYEKISKDKEEQTIKRIRNTELKIQNLIDKSKKLTEIQNEIRKLLGKKQEMINKTEFHKSEINRLRFTDNNLSNQTGLNQNLIELNKISMININKKISILEERFLKNSQLCDLIELKKKQEKILLKFEDLKSYFCPINPLKEFEKTN